MPIPTYGHVPPLSGEVRSGLQGVLEAGHRPLTVGGASCGGLVQRQVLDTADETADAWALKFIATQLIPCFKFRYLILKSLSD